MIIPPALASQEFCRNTMLVFLHENLLIAYLEIQDTNSKIFCKKKKSVKFLLGSKTLGTKCIRTSICYVLANHDQNLESKFRLLKVYLFVKCIYLKQQILIDSHLTHHLHYIYLLFPVSTEWKLSLNNSVLKNYKQVQLSIFGP